MMRAITIRQPYAECIAIGRKTVENRPRSTGYRGEVAIHAAGADHRAGRTDPRVLALFGPDPTLGMARGAIVALAELTDCHEAGGCCGSWGDPDGWHLVLTGARLLCSPVPAKGSLALPWHVPADVEAAVRAAAACSCLQVAS